MENHIITGVGCFAEPEKLSRIFMRVVQTYTLGKLDGIEWIISRESDESEGTRLVKALVAGETARLDTTIPDGGGRYKDKTITGFFLTLRGQNLELSIFAKNGDCRRERHSAVLDEFTKIRQKRLN